MLKLKMGLLLWKDISDKDVQRRDLESPGYAACLAEIKGMIVSHDSRSYHILDV